MTGRLAYIAVTMLFCVFTVATSASAECAWVLWLEDYRDSKDMKARSPHWAIDSSYYSGPETCFKTQIEKTSVAEKKKGNSVTLADGTVVTLVCYLCLPDTVDPRGSKGK